MPIYFSGAISGGRDNLPVYQHIVERLLRAGHEIPSAHVADPAVLSRESNISPRAVYLRDVGWIKECDAMVLVVATYADLDELDAHLDSFIKSLPIKCDG